MQSRLYVVLSSVERNESPNHTKQLEDSKIYLQIGMSIYNQCENLRMKEATNELASFILSLNLGSEEMLLYMLCWHERKSLMHSTTWLSWWIWHGVEKSIWVRI